MAQEKKKRWRPSLTAYRALENENSQLKEELANYKRMEKCNIPQVNEAAQIELCQLRTEKRTLEQSNKLMKEELDRVREANNESCRLNVQLSNKLQAIKSRGFWKRVFNHD